MNHPGQPITRFDGPAKVTGGARFAGDQNLPGQLYGVFVTATIPAGQVTAIDAGQALVMPDVAYVLTAADMPHGDRWRLGPGRRRLQPALAPRQPDGAVRHPRGMGG